jgi:hypothetical protein
VAAVHPELLEVYAPVAKPIYAKAAEKFDATATAFSSAASVVDCESPAVQMVNRPDVERTGWTQAESLAAKLTTLVPVVSTAASLGGIDGIDPNVPNDTVLLPLVCDPADRHRRRIWEAFTIKDPQNDGRCGRWGRLLKVGATIRACPIDEHASYRECRPPEHRKVEFARGQYRTEVHDPEDADHRPPPIDPRRPRGRMVVA